MDAKEITETVLALPIGAKKRLCAKLIWDIDRLAHLADAGDRYAQVVAVAEEVTNMRNDPARKDAGSVFVRTITAWAMLDEGYKLAEIGKAMGKDHSTVAYLKRLRRNAAELPAAYAQYNYAYKKLKKALR